MCRTRAPLAGGSEQCEGLREENLLPRHDLCDYLLDLAYLEGDIRSFFLCVFLVRTLPSLLGHLAPAPQPPTTAQVPLGSNSQVDFRRSESFVKSEKVLFPAGSSGGSRGTSACRHPRSHDADHQPERGQARGLLRTLPHRWRVTVSTASSGRFPFIMNAVRFACVAYVAMLPMC